MRKEFGRVINELAKKDEKILLLVGDLGYEIFDEFKKNFPKRYFNLGICEQTMISMSAGMALEGFKPYLFTITPFFERAFEQIKLDVVQQKQNVKLVGYADYPHAGPTHKELNWKILGQALDGLCCYFPKNSIETKEVLIQSYVHKHPSFISLKKEK